MDAPRPAMPAMPAVNPEAIDFVRFCYRRRRVGWPELYDEMCAVAGRAHFRGYGSDDLAGIGISLCLGDMPGLAAIAHEVIREEQASRRPVAVRIVADDVSERPAASQETAHDGGRPSLRGLSPVTAGA
jgi:hypothetical protein